MPIQTFTQFITEETSPEEHPFHKAVIDSGMKHSYTTDRGSKVTHMYTPDHHWKTGVTLHTVKRKGSEPKHSWKGTGSAEGKDEASLKTHLGHVQSRYDTLIAHHKAGTGPFKS